MITIILIKYFIQFKNNTNKNHVWLGEKVDNRKECKADIKCYDCYE